MEVIIDGIAEAFRLIARMDQEVFEVVFTSLKVSLLSLVIAASIGIPAGILIVGHRFRGRLMVYLFFMRRGPFGSLRLNYTVAVMVIAQTLLILPILTGLTVSTARERQEKIIRLARTLGAGRFHTMKLLLWELRPGLITALISGFSRGISEVGAVMIVGGNIEGKTRTMTTYISQLKGMGEFERAVAVGIILLVLSFGMNAVLCCFQEDRADL